MISSETTTVQYPGNATQKYIADIEFLDDPENLYVVVLDSSGTENKLDYTEGTNGSTNFTYDSTTNEITTGYAWTAADLITITTDLDYLQKTDITSNSNYDPEVLEMAYDNAVLLTRQNKDKIGRSLSLAVSDSGESMVLPPKASLANSYLHFDSNGDPEPQIGVLPRVYDTEFLYLTDDITSYNGDLWIAVQDIPQTSNINDYDPGDDTSYWEIYVDRKNSWNAKILYGEGETVTYDGILYIALNIAGNIAQIPAISSSYWEVYVSRFGQWDEGIDYPKDIIVSYQTGIYDAVFVKSLQTPNLGNAPDLVPGATDNYWEIVKTGGSLETEGTVLAATTVNTAMYFDTDGKLHTADNRELSKSFSAGLLVTATSGANETSSVLSGGKMDGFAGALTPGQDYYLGNSGNLIAKGSIAYSEYIVYIGRAIDINTLDVKVKGPEPNRNYDDGIKIGGIIEWGGNEDLSDIPDGYLACDGSAISRANYSELNSLMSAASYPWGSGDGSTTFNLPKSSYDTGWVSASTWTSGASIIINHDFGVPFDEYTGQIFVRESSSVPKIYNATDIENQTSSNNGQRLNGFNRSGDYLNNCYLQIGDNVPLYLNDSGAESAVPTTWEYKVVVTQKAMSARSIIKVEHITTAGEPISATQYSTPWIENLIDGGTTPNWTNVHLGDDGTQDSNVNHNLGVPLSELDVKLFISTDGTDNNSFETKLSGSSSSSSWGLQVNAVDNNNFYFQTGDRGIIYISDSGGETGLDNEAWYYKIVVTKINKVATYADTSFRKVYEITDATNYTFTLPDASTQITEYYIERFGSGAGEVSFASTSGQTINGNPASSWGLKGNSSVTFLPIGGNWRVKDMKGFTYHVQDQKASGTSGGTPVTGSWQTRDLNTIIDNEVKGSSLASNQITLPAGRYKVLAHSTYYQTVSTVTRLYDTTGSISLAQSTNMHSPSANVDFITSILKNTFTLSISSVIELQYYVGGATSSGLGGPMSIGVPEIYSDIAIEKIG